MHYRAVVAALLAAARSVAGHPLCYDDTPPDLEQKNTFCGEQQAGSCCTDIDDMDLQTSFNLAGDISGDCAAYFKELMCAPCHSFSGHLYARLVPPLNLGDGLTMKKDFCNGLVAECTGQGIIEFPSVYEDSEEGELDYCERHTGTQSGDFTWSFPFTEDTTWEPGLNLAFANVDQPSKTLSVKQSPDSSMFWIMGQDGEIISVNPDGGSRTQVINIGPNNTATIDGGTFHVESEEGLLDFAFDPNFDGASGAFYLSHTVRLNDGALPRNRLSKFEYSPGNAAATRASEEILLTTVPKATGIHAAGWLDFKPSDFSKPGPVGSSHDIYWSSGDGGGQLDPLDVSQNEANMLGAIIRISVSASSTGYGIPSGNIGSPGDPLTKTEICASGFRNPWRCGFDRETDELYCGDVGHTKVEEIDVVECGKNYGWSIFEGNRCLAEKPGGPDCSAYESAASRGGFTFPYYEYCHDAYRSTNDVVNTGGYDLCGERQLIGEAIIGGYVYRGELFADLLWGAYIFADTVNRNVYYLQEAEDGTVTVGSIISDRSVEAIGFSQTVNGELLIIDRNYDIYHLPCGDLCDSTCLDKAENLPTFEYEGCFKDVNSNRALPEQAPGCPEGQKAMSAEVCASYCATIPGMEYMGVQFSFQCFCGGSEVASGGAYYGRYGSADNCDMPCSATPDETCGGSGAMEVFKLLAPDQTNITTELTNTTDTGPTSIGCFNDVATDRIMTLESSSATMTTEVCAALCVDSAFFGTQYGKQCWCGSADDYDRHGASTKCSMACAGAADQICGGNYAASVYSTDGVDTGTPSPIEIGGLTPSPAEATEPTLLGCFKDVGTDRIMTLDSSADPMSAKICAALCVDSAFFGTQYGKQCWCGSADDYDKHGTSTNCDMDCAGTPGETCGGSYAATVYSHDGTGPSGTPSPVSPPPAGTPSPVEAPETTLLGCFKDTDTDRIMTLEAASTSMNAEICAALCIDSAFFATQFGNQCWCGSEDDYDRHGTSTKCNIYCAGAADEICGGYFAASVYSNGGGGNPPTVEPSPVEPVNTPSPVSPPVDTTLPTGGTTLLGCFNDVGSDRIMTLELGAASTMSAEICAGLCFESPYFATQFGNQCWCGSADDYDRHGTSTKCNIDCAGAADEICGGYNAASVYTKEL